MKNFKQLVESLPSKTVVLAFGRFNPPSAGHEILVNAVKKIAKANSADYVIYASASQDPKKNPLPVDKKLEYLKLMFPGTNFVAAGGTQRTYMEVAKYLNSKYDNLIMIAGSDRVEAYTKTLHDYNGKDYNYESIKVISAGARDPDADDASGVSASKLREYAKNGDFDKLRKWIPLTLRDLDVKRLMNDVRVGMKLEPIKEEIKFEVTDLREQYISGRIFNIGNIVEVSGRFYAIKSRGSNYLTVYDSDGVISKKWLTECKETDLQIEQLEEFNRTEESMSYETPIDKTKFISETTLKLSDKTKVANVIADMLGVDGADKMSPDQAVEAGLRKVKSKKMTPEFLKVVEKMIKLAHSVGIKCDPSTYPPELKHLGSVHEAKINDIMNFTTYKRSKEMNELGVDPVPMPEDDGHGKVGKSLHADHNSPVRKMKIKHMTEGWGAEGQKKAHAESQAKWEALKDKYKDHAEMSKHLAKLHTYNWKAEYAESEAKKLAGIKEETSLEEQADFMPDVINTKKVIHGKNKDEFLKQLELLRKRGGPEYSTKVLRQARSLMTKEELESFESLTINEEFDDYFDLSDEELESMANSVDHEDDIMDLYDDEELAIIDDETGEHVDDLQEEVILEVLSRMERIKAKVRFKRTEAKRERKLKIALRQHSSAKKINSRARKLAIKMMKQRLLRKDPTSYTVSDKERAERIIAKKKNLIDRLAMKLTGRVRKIENERLAHHTYTK